MIIITNTININPTFICPFVVVFANTGVHMKINKFVHAMNILSIIPMLNTLRFFNSLHASQNESYVDFLLIAFGLFSHHVKCITHKAINETTTANVNGARNYGIGRNGRPQYIPGFGNQYRKF